MYSQLIAALTAINLQP